MSETHYWPTEPGVYELERYTLGGPTHTYRYDGSRWTYIDDAEVSQETDDLIRDYYLGVRREPVRVTITGVSDLTPPPLSARDTEMIEMAAAESKVEELKAEIAKLKADFDNAKEDACGWMLVANEHAAEVEKLRAEVERLQSAVNRWVEIDNKRQDEADGLSTMLDERESLIREAIAEFRRDVKQPTMAADWAFKWVGRFIEAVES